MDEEGGVHGSRRGRNLGGLSSSSLAAAPSAEEMTSLTPVDTNENPTDENEHEGLWKGSDDAFNGSGDYESEENEYDDDDDDDERTGFLGSQSKSPSSIARATKHRSKRSSSRTFKTWQKQRRSRKGRDNLLHKTLLPDSGLSVRGYVLLEPSGVVTKLLKFIVWTFLSIIVVHVVVGHLFDDRDAGLKVSHIWRYEADLIVRDCFVFFVVGRLWEKPGIDHLAWMGTAFLANVYFESQNFVWFLQHSVTLFQMHCIWPWELWVFALVLVVASAGLVLAHAIKAWRDELVVAKLTEVGLCVLFFMAPMVTSNYFHLHHWYAGWLMGMQFNYDVW